MRSSPRKAKFTQLVLNIARRAPKLLPKRLKYLVTSYPFDGPENEENRIDRASYFYDPENRIVLKGVNMVIEISSEELTHVEQWHRQSNINELDERHIGLIYSREYLSHPRENVIGCVRFDDKTGFHCIDKIECKAKLFHSCLVTLVHLPSGSLYLNFFFWAESLETSFVQGISASHLDPTIEFQGYNLFCRSNLVTWHFDRAGLAEQLVREGLASLNLEVLHNFNALLKKMRINTAKNRYIFKAWEFVNNDSVLRYPSAVTGRIATDEAGREFVHVAYNRPDFYGIQGQSLYLDMNDFKRENYDLLCVSSRRFESFDTENELDNFRSAANRVFESLVVMSLVESIHAKIRVQLKILESEIGFRAQASEISKKQQKLFSIVECLSKIRDELDELKRHRGRVCPKPYLNLFELRIEALEKIAEKILARADREYKFTNDMIGIKVVRSNSNFSWVLAFFAMVQIALAYLAIDWDKAQDASNLITAARSWCLVAYIEVASWVQDIGTRLVQTF